MVEDLGIKENSSEPKETISESEEKLIKELDEVAKEILERQVKEKEREVVTNPSAIALTTPKSDTGDGMSKVRKSVKQLFTLYLTNQYVARAINVRADTLVSKGYEFYGGSEEGQKRCAALVDNSGGINLFWQLSVNCDISGDGFLEKIYNQNKTAIVRLQHVHPLTLGFKKDLQTEKIIVGSDKMPVGYIQKYIDSKGLEQEQDVDKDIIEHLKYNVLGDEFTGISVIQPAYDTIVRLMNMEYSAAEAAVKTANPLVIGKCNTKSPHQIAQWSTILGRMSGKEQIFIPEGMEIDFKSPGPQNFSDYSEYFLNAIVAGFGVPKSVLLGDGGGNRAEGVILSRHFYSLIREMQKYQEDFFNKIFIEYGEIAGFEAPKLIFNDIAEDMDLMADSAIKLLTAGVIDRNEAREMLGYEKTSVDNMKNPKIPSDAQDIAKETKQAQFPATPGKAAGSQKGIKAAQKRSSTSLVKSNTK